MGNIIQKCHNKISTTLTSMVDSHPIVNLCVPDQSYQNLSHQLQESRLSHQYQVI